MFARILAFAAIFAYFVQTACAVNGYDAGGWKYTGMFDMGTKANPDPAFAPYHVQVIFPKLCNKGGCGEFQTGGFPVFMFVTGFGGSIDTASYNAVLDGIARHGIIVVAVDRASGLALTLDYHTLGIQLQKVAGWIRKVDPNGGLLYELQQNKFTGTIRDAGAKIVLGGHSSGVHLALRYVRDVALSQDICPTEFGAVVMISPLDGQDPLGLGGDNLLDAEHHLPFTMPGLIVSGSLDAVAGSVAGASCAPDDRGPPAFFKDWVGGLYEVNVQDVGHLDMLNDGATNAYTQFCATSNSSAYRANYRRVVRGLAVNFIQSVILKSTDYIKYLGEVPVRDTVVATFANKDEGLIAFSCAAVPIETGMMFEYELGLILFGILFGITFITGLCCFFRKMDDDTLHRYHAAEGITLDNPASFQTKLEPQYSMSQSQFGANPSYNLGQAGGSRVPSVNV